VHEEIAPTLQAEKSENRGGTQGPMVYAETTPTVTSSVTDAVARDNEGFLVAEEESASSAASPARTSASPASGKDSEAAAPASIGRSSVSSQEPLFGPSSFSSRMSRDSSRLAAVVDAESAASFYAGIETEAVQELRALREATPAAIPTPSSPAGSAPAARRRSGSASVIPAPTSPWSAPRWRTSGIASATAYSTADTSESPRDGAECSSSLSSILERTVAERYYLSPTAALGILSRAGRRGRELPQHLRAALEAVVREDPELAKQLAT
jgi:hypothetical protein